VTGEYTADCAHWTISMQVGREFPPCPQCHQVVEYRMCSGAWAASKPTQGAAHRVRYLQGDRRTRPHNTGSLRWWSRWRPWAHHLGRESKGECFPDRLLVAPLRAGPRWAHPLGRAPGRRLAVAGSLLTQTGSVSARVTPLLI